jgi:DNA-binding transcriptional ArsR family regulator
MSPLQKEMEKLGKGIGNANRYRILEVLMRGSRTVSEIAASTKLAQPAVSQNLKVLKEANLVLDERRGQEVYYSVHVAYMAKLLRKLSEDVESCPSAGTIKNKTKH